jgi:hypothetical protein
MDAVQPDRRKLRRDTDAQPGGRRGEPRAQIRLAVAVETLDGKKQARLLEVSMSGARLEGPGLPAAGKDVVLLGGAAEAFGTIVWTAGERCGMHFDEPIGASELIALRRVAVAIEESGITPEELQAAADWESGLAR